MKKKRFSCGKYCHFRQSRGLCLLCASVPAVFLGAGPVGCVAVGDASLPCSAVDESKQHCTLATFHPAQRLDEAGKKLTILPKYAVSLS